MAFSTNASGSRNSRNAMPLVNLGWANNGLMWDGRTIDLEAASEDAILSELHPNPSAILDILRVWIHCTLISLLEPSKMGPSR